MNDPLVTDMLLALASRGTVSLRHNGDDCVVIFEWPPSQSDRTSIKMKGDGWAVTIGRVVDAVAAICTVIEAQEAAGA